MAQTSPQEVAALRGAFDDLIDRMQDIVEASLQKVAVVATERGLSSDFDLKRPSIWFWKRALCSLKWVAHPLRVRRAVWIGIGVMLELWLLTIPPSIASARWGIIT